MKTIIMESEAGKSTVKMRFCLGGCEKDFLSKGPGERICPICTKRNNKSYRGGKTSGRSNGHTAAKRLST